MAGLRVVLDTNLWVYLAEGLQGLALTDELLRLHRAGTIDIVLPAIVQEEFDGLRDGIAEKYGRALQGHLNSAKTLAGVDGFADKLNQLIPELTAGIQEAKNRVPQTLDRIAALFREVQTLTLGDAQQLKILNRLRKALPPASKVQSSSVGDCYIWESVLVLLDRTDVAFATNNKRDFSNPKNESELHPMLVAEVERKAYRLVYRTSIGALFAVTGAREEALQRARKAEEDEARLKKALEEVDRWVYGADALDYEAVLCPECNNDTVIAPGPKGGVPRCAHCKARFEDAEVCPKCGSWQLFGLVDCDVCDECFEHAVGKD